jgi:hypothetical protein
MFSMQLAVDISDAANPRAIQDSTGYLCWRENVFGHTPWAAVAQRMLDTYGSTEEQHGCVAVESRACVLVANAYTGWNLGHNLSTLFWCLWDMRHQLEDHPEIMIVLNRRTFDLCPCTRDLLGALVPSQERWLFLEEDTVYRFTDLIIPHNHFFDLHHAEMPTIIRTLLDPSRSGSAMMGFPSAPIPCVALFKLEHHPAARGWEVMRDAAVDALRQRGWYVPDVLSTPILELIRVLQRCRVCLIGTGAVNYAHRCFINANASVVLWCDGPHSYREMFPIPRPCLVASPSESQYIERDAVMAFLASEPLGGVVGYIPPMVSLAKVFTVTKNEYDLIEDWIMYHGWLVGYENVIIIDNGSTDERVLEVYRRYTERYPDLTIEHRLGYEGTSQGDHFTRSIQQWRHACRLVFALDTDQFMCSDEYTCDRDRIHSAMEAMDASGDCVFIKPFHLNSLPDVQCESFVQHGRYHRPARQCTSFRLNRFPRPAEYVYKSKHFVRTENGNHRVFVSCADGSRVSPIGCFHFHTVGLRRSLERAAAICAGYGYVDESGDHEMQLDEMLNHETAPVFGSHRFDEYLRYLCRRWVVETCATGLHFLPSPEQIEALVGELHRTKKKAEVYAEMQSMMGTQQRVSKEGPSPVSRDQMEQAVYNEGSGETDDAADHEIVSLRDALEAITGSP